MIKPTHHPERRSNRCRCGAEKKIISKTCLKCGNLLSKLRSSANHKGATQEYREEMRRQLDILLANIERGTLEAL